MFNVVYCCNNLYAPYVGVSMLSFLEHNYKDFDGITMHIINDDVSDDYKDKLTKITDKYENVSIKFHDFNLSDYNCEPKRRFNHPIAFSFLFISSILEDVDKAMYLDADSIITGSYKDMYDNVDISNKFGAAVLDIPIPYLKRNLGIEGKDYYNNGFFWLNLDYIRENNLVEKFVEVVNTRAYLPFCDQDTISIVMNDKDVVKLHPKYNFVGYFSVFDYDNVMNIFSLEPEDYYSKEEIDEAMADPIFNHFIDLFAGAPWNDTTNPRYELYMKYAKMTPFEYDEIFQEKPLSLWRRTVFKLRFILPNSLFAKFSAFYLRRFVDEPNLKEQ